MISKIFSTFLLLYKNLSCCVLYALSDAEQCHISKRLVFLSERQRVEELSHLQTGKTQTRYSTQFLDKSAQVGFNLEINAFFLRLVHPLSCFSLAIAE